MPAVVGGDEGAFASLYDLLAPSVYGIIFKVLRDRFQSEEVAQEVFVELWRKAATFDPALAGVRAWACTIAHRRAVDRVRCEQRHRNRLLGMDPPHDAMGATPETAAMDVDDSRRAKVALGRLPRNQREAVSLAYYGGLTHVQIAAHLDVPLGTIKTRIRSGLIGLRQAMECVV